MAISRDVKLGDDVRIPHRDLVNLYGCTIGDQTFVGPFVEIQRGVLSANDAKYHLIRSFVRACLSKMKYLSGTE